MEASPRLTVYMINKLEKWDGTFIEANQSHGDYAADELSYNKVVHKHSYTQRPYAQIAD